MSSSSYYGLSLPERLKKAASTEAFFLVLQQKNTAEMTRILLSIDYSLDAANATIKTLLNDSTAFQH